MTRRRWGPNVAAADESWPVINADALGPLFEAPSVPVDTSEAAARTITPHAGAIRERIVAYIAAQGSRGATEREISQALGLSSSTTRPRLREAEGTAPWAKGKLPRRIRKSDTKRGGMRVYVAC